MKVKYLKNDWNAVAGTVRDVRSDHAELLVAIGKAERYTEPKRKKKHAS